MGKVRMNPNTVAIWASRGWHLEPTLIVAPGEIINTGGRPYYFGEQKEIGYCGHAQPLIVSRYCIGTKLGRPLTRNEIVRFRSKDKKNLRLSNLVLHSKSASAAELYRVNSDPILGYSHCLCGCGTRLDLERQKQEPHAFAEGHRPRSRNDAPKEAKRARAPRSKVLQEKLLPIAPLEREQLMDMPTPEAAQSIDTLKEFRVLFEKMIHNLSWNEFKELLHLLLEIHTRQEKSKE